MKQNANSRRLASELREKLGYILLFEISDPHLQLITVTGVEVSIDKGLARIYVSCAAEDYEDTLFALDRAKGRIRSLLGRALSWRTVPELVFCIDTTTDEAERISKALENVPPFLGVEKDEFGYPVSEVDEDASVQAEGAQGTPDDADAPSEEA